MLSLLCEKKHIEMEKINFKQKESMTLHAYKHVMLYFNKPLIKP